MSENTSEAFSLLEFPAPIVHIDCDAFFTSVEQALDPKLRGLPVATGRERGIIACASYEARARGVRRPMRMRDAKKICPELVCLESDYETYSLFSKRMFSILRRFTPVVEESSIDEAFAELGGLRRLYRKDFPGIARDMKAALQKELGITVSAGLSASKTLAKIASGWRKPDGFSALPARVLHEALKKVPLERVSGFGPSTRALLLKFGISNAYQFAVRDPAWVRKVLGRKGVELYHELRGEAVYALDTEEKSRFLSVTRVRSFSPPSSDAAFVHSSFVKNTEAVFEKLRRHRMKAASFLVFLRDGDFRFRGVEAQFQRSTDHTMEAVRLLSPLFARLFSQASSYRQTGVAAFDLGPDEHRQYDLFEDEVRICEERSLDRITDDLNARFGRDTLRLGSRLLFDREMEKRGQCDKSEGRIERGPGIPELKIHT